MRTGFPRPVHASFWRPFLLSHDVSIGQAAGTGFDLGHNFAFFDVLITISVIDE